MSNADVAIVAGGLLGFWLAVSLLGSIRDIEDRVRKLEERERDRTQGESGRLK